MRSNTTTKIFPILFLLVVIGFSSSCTKDHDLVSNLVIMEKLELNSNLVKVSDELSPIALKEPKLINRIVTTP